jgi:hypothetical protein
VREREDRETVLARKRGRGLWNFFLFAIFFFFLFARFFYAIFFFWFARFFFYASIGATTVWRYSKQPVTSRPNFVSILLSGAPSRSLSSSKHSYLLMSIGCIINASSLKGMNRIHHVIHSSEMRT